tara:strand:+ start:207 stop:914 length:708 start_codon:yes stop_codon:yes gene_type:complete
MATTNSTDFNMNFTEIAEEAWERAGREMRSGYDLRTARRSMNLLTIEWANRGINMWTITEGSKSLVAGEATSILSDAVATDNNAQIIDVIEQNIRTGASYDTTQNDLSIPRVSVSDYNSIPNKNTQGRPTQIFIDRGTSNVTAYLWPVPDKTYTLNFWYLRRIQDAGAGDFTPDMPFRFLPCLVAGLAYYIAMKTPELSGRVMMLKDIYDEQFEMAASEDRSKVSARFVPRIGYP